MKKRNSDWEKATDVLIDVLGFKCCKTQGEVRSKILEYFKEYEGEPVAKLEALAGDFAESVCLKLDINQGK